MKWLVFVVLVVSMVASVAVVNAEARYTVTDLGSLGGSTGMAYAINNLGQVVGMSQDHRGAPSAFLYSSGRLINIGSFGGPSSAAYDINDLGQIVGQSQDENEMSHAFLYSDGVMVEINLSLPNISLTGMSAKGINNKGQIVGTVVKDGKSTIFLYSAGAMSFIEDSSGNTYSEVSDINDNGDIIGKSDLGPFLYKDGVILLFSPTVKGKSYRALAMNNYDQIVGQSHEVLDKYAYYFTNRAILWQTDGTMVDVASIGGSSFDARGINDKGQIVGSGFGGAFIWENEVRTNLNTVIASNTGWRLDSAEDINEAGWIVGRGLFEGMYKPFLLTPIVPEPASLLVLGSGVIRLAGIHRRRRK